MTLQTTYLGLKLAHPFMVGASPLADSLDVVKRLEDGGSAAIVLRSLFEEQITMAESARIHQRDPADPDFAVALRTFPRPDNYSFSPDAYLEHVRRVKDAVKVPVIASLNGISAQSWAKFSRDIEQAGADALELNIYEMATDPSESSAAIEARIRDLVIDIKHVIRIPVAV
ncbi:MAG: dihydroorotate dehydrogenase-like protein, partial [Thermoanaerobaculia bacterium]